MIDKNDLIDYDEPREFEQMKDAQIIKCQFCGESKGNISITDSETEQEVLICESCDQNMKWEQSNNIIKESDKKWEVKNNKV